MNAEEVRAYLGEWENGLRERTGGYLDMIKSPSVFTINQSKPLMVTRRDDHLSITTVTAADVRLVEAGAVSVNKQSGLRTKRMFHAKVGRTDTRVGLDLELVPLTPNGKVFVLLLRGHPVAKAALELFGPPRWGKNLKTDERGQVTFPLPWAGRYVAEATHIENEKGGEGEAAYDRIRHAPTLSFVAFGGLPTKNFE